MLAIPTLPSFVYPAATRLAAAEQCHEPRISRQRPCQMSAPPDEHMFSSHHGTTVLRRLIRTKPIDDNGPAGSSLSDRPWTLRVVR